MPFVTDPDSLDRNQVIYNLTQKLLYVKGVNTATAKVSGGNATFDADNPSAGTHTVTSAGANFQTNGVVVGDIFCLQPPSQNAGHWRVSSVDSESQIKVQPLTGDQATAVDELTANKVYSVRAATGGTVEPGGASLFADVGVTLQSLYSFTKEEWKDDSLLIPIQFPFELITREQGEIGGGNDNDDWKFGNDVTTQLIRTGGWDKKNTAGISQNQYSGVVTLGALDDDAQVYYLQQGGGTPANFVRTGPVNQALLVYVNGGNDYRTFLNLFVRKKGRSYAKSAIADIGVTTIETIVNRFPLSHANDPAIVYEDGELAGAGIAATDVFQAVSTHSTGTGGVSTDPDTTDDEITFTDTGAGWSTLKPRDTLEITSGPAGDQRVYEVKTVTGPTELRLFREPGQTLVGGSSLTWTARTRIRSAEKTDGVLANVDGNTGTLSSAGADFVADGVAAGDMVAITAGAAAHLGVYKVISRDTAQQLTLNTSDKAFTAQSGQTFTVFRPGMHLQYKKEALATLGSAQYGTLEFTAPDLITRTTGSWISDGYSTPGRTIVITGAANPANNGTFTVESATATVLTIVEVTLATEGPSTTETVNGSIPFIRNVSGPLYGFNWRLFANGGTLGEIYQWLQRQLRRMADIDEGNGTSRGDITDLLMTFASPTGRTLNLFPDDVDAGELNNMTMLDATGRDRNFAFIVGIRITLNQNLLDDPATNRVVVFFTDLPGTLDYGTPDAVIVNDKDGNPMNFPNQAASPIITTFDYDGNDQGGRSPGTPAAITVVGIGLDSAQFVLATATITKVNSVELSLVSALERNYST